MRQTDNAVEVSDTLLANLMVATTPEGAEANRLRVERDLLLSSLQGVIFMLELDPKLDTLAELRLRLKEYRQTAAMLLEIEKEKSNG